MPKRIPFEIVKAFESEDDFITWKKEQNFSWSVTKSNKSKCTLCKSCQHQMITNYTSCNNADCLTDHVRLRGLEVFPQKLRTIRQRQRKRHMDASFETA